MFLLEGFEVSGLFSWSINFLMFINSWKAWGRCFVESRAKCRWLVGEVVIKVEVKIGEGVGMPAVSIFEHRTHVSIWLYIEKQTNLKLKLKISQIEVRCLHGPQLIINDYYFYRWRYEINAYNFLISSPIYTYHLLILYYWKYNNKRVLWGLYSGWDCDKLCSIKRRNKLILSYI